MKKTLITLVLAFLLVPAWGQIDMRVIKAKNFFQQGKYELAITELNKIQDKDVTVLSRIAESYIKMHRTDEAEFWYKKLFERTPKDAENLKKYIEVVIINQRIAKAKKLLDKYKELTNDVVDYEDLRKKVYSSNVFTGYDYKISALSVNTDQADFSTSFYKDKVVYIAHSKDKKRKKKKLYSLYVADKNSKGELSNVKLLSEKLISKYHEGPAVFTSDNKTIYFTRNNQHLDKRGVRRLEIFRSTFKDNEWTKPEHLKFNSKKYSCGHPALSPDGTKLYFSSDMPGGFGGTDIYVCNIDEDGTIGKPKNAGAEINSKGNEMFPFVQANGVMYFASNGHKGLGGLDIFFTINDENGFTKPVNLGNTLNSKADDFGFIIDSEDKQGYISSNRGEKGDDDIYLITKESLNRKLICKVNFQTVPVEGAKVDIYRHGKLVNTIFTKKEGEVVAELEDFNTYELKINKGGFKEELVALSHFSNVKGRELSLIVELEKQEIKEKKLYCMVKSGRTYLSEASVKLVDKEGKLIKELITGSNGFVSFNKVDFKTNSLVVNKSGFDKQIVDLLYVNSKADADVVDVIVSMSKPVDLTSSDLKAGDKFELKNILYDLNKWTLRKESKVELNKLVNFLKSNPTAIIELGSHTDSRGSAKYNKWLSDKRAESAAEYVISKGVIRTQVISKGYGEEKLKNKCNDNNKCPDEFHQVNRRTEVTIIQM